MVVHTYYPRVAPRTQRQAERLVEAGYSVDVICLQDRGEPSREQHRGVEIHRLPVRINKSGLGRQFLSYVNFFARASVRLTKLHRRDPYGTIQVHNLPDFLVFCALVPKCRGVPVILDLHDLMPEFFAGRFGRSRRWLGWLILLQERLACRFADHVITVSEDWRQALIRRGVPEEKCSVTMNVPDEQVFAPRRRRPSVGPGSRLIFHGTVAYRYGLDLAIRAVGLVRTDFPDIRFTILGFGDQMPDLVELRKELGLEAHVEFREEPVLREELPEIIGSADLAIVPYRNDVFTDGIVPTKVMEYGVMGVPCIAARTTAIEAYFRDTFVELFEPGDVEDLARCIRELLASPERREELAGRAGTFTQRYNWTGEGARYIALVDELSGRSTARSRSRGNGVRIGT